MIKKLFDKCVDWAGRKYANFALAFVSFIESSFFPVPPDVMIIPMVIAKKQHFIKIALIATIFSVLGGLFGYLIGYVFFNEIGFKIFQFYGYENVNVLKEMFSSKQGMFSWFGLLFVAGFTPLPFKILTITSGFIHYNIFTFIGTGVSINDPNGDSPGQYYPAQNLPYSTHILQSTRKSGTDAVEFVIDGVNLGTQSNCTKGR